MPASEPTVELDRRFSSEGAKPIPWHTVVDVIEPGFRDPTIEGGDGGSGDVATALVSV